MRTTLTIEDDVLFAAKSLARLEGRIAIGRFLQRFPDYRLTQMPTRGGRARFRGFLHAPFALA